MRFIINVLIDIYMLFFAILYMVVFLVSIILFPIHRHVIRFFDWALFERLPEPVHIPEPPKMYCGPFYFPYFIRKIMSKNFNNACKIHDEGYNAQPTSRYQIDKLFLRNMLRSIENGRGTKSGAYTMYYLVRYVVGLPSWYIIKLYKKLGGKI